MTGLAPSDPIRADLSDALANLSPDTSPTVVLVPSDLRVRMEEAISSASEFAVVTAENLEEADTLHRRIHEHAKAVEDARKRLKGPILTMGRVIDDAARGMASRLEEAKRGLQSMISVFQAQERERERREREAAALREAQERARRERAEAERRAKEEGEAASAFDLFADEDEEAEETAPAPEPAPRVAPARKSSSVTEVRRTVLRELDATQTPARYMVPDRIAIEKALRAGLEVPGWELGEDVSTRAL